MTSAVQCFRQSPDVVYRRVAGESILVPIRGNVADMQRLYALDGVGEFAWQQLDGQRSVADVAAAIAQAFDVDQETALTDLVTFLDQLLEQGVVIGTGDHGL
ncbi:MAG: PqqD family protein [Lentisphaerae bacterium]|nr:PqqD family protein [Lentisphaerota bacterium]